MQLFGLAILVVGFLTSARGHILGWFTVCEHVIAERTNNAFH